MATRLGTPSFTMVFVGLHWSSKIGSLLGGGFKICFIFTPIWGKIPTLTIICFQMGWNHQLVCHFFKMVANSPTSRVSYPESSPFLFARLGAVGWTLNLQRIQQILGGGTSIFFVIFTPRDMIQFDEHIFGMGWNHQLELKDLRSLKARNKRHIKHVFLLN